MKAKYFKKQNNMNIFQTQDLVALLLERRT